MDNTLLLKRNRYEFESSSEKTPEFKEFAKDMKKYLQNQCQNYNLTLVNFSVWHFYLSWFFKLNDKFVYFSMPDVRDYAVHNRFTSILFRTAKNEKDFSWWSNNYCTFDQLAFAAKNMLDR